MRYPDHALSETDRHLQKALNKYLPRVGITKKDRLRWAMQKVDAYRQDQGKGWSPGDWENAYLELAVFCGIGKLLPGHRGIKAKDGEILRPSHLETDRA